MQTSASNWKLQQSDFNFMPLDAFLSLVFYNFSMKHWFSFRLQIDNSTSIEKHGAVASVSTSRQDRRQVSCKIDHNSLISGSVELFRKLVKIS